QRPSSTVVANNFASLLADHRASDPEQLDRAFNIAKRFRGSDQPYLTDTYAWLLHLTGSSADALPLLRRAAEQLPTNPLVQYHLGVVLAANGEFSQARNRIERAITLSEQVNFSHLDRAQEVLERIDVLEAERDKASAKPGQKQP
ncbi:MAG: tetratricopeptide repeat protein, partial [Pseudomonadota bacterium]|nr:tetratricopeptide repeat protein [Pseudomonadota bacterium]